VIQARTRRDAEQATFEAVGGYEYGGLKTALSDDCGRVEESQLYLEFHCPACDAGWHTRNAAPEAAAVCPFCAAEGTFLGEHENLPELDLEQVELRQREYRIAERKAAEAEATTCQFCAVELRHGANKSREHVLARWIGELPMYEGVVEAAKSGRPTWTWDGPQFRDGVVLMPTPRLHTNKHAHELATTVPVCGDCNSGWMSRLEEAATPALQPLIEGSTDAVSAEARAILARWVGKVAFAYEVDDLPTSQCTWEQILDVRFGGPPRGAAIWAARWGQPDSPKLRHGLAREVAQAEDGIPTVTWRGSQMIVAVGHVVFYMVYTEGNTYPPVLDPGAPWIQLWPGAGDTQLMAPALTIADLDALMSYGVTH
jgi:hypothetical protein